jgi:hemerythrin-like domain-containing protein
MSKKATEVLEEEHRVIQRMAASLAVVREEIEQGTLVESKTLHILGQFLEVFVEQCHHRKEEAYLFTMLERKGVPASGCPLAVLHHEHDTLCALVSQYADSAEVYIATQGAARVSLINTIHALLELLPGHIWKEDFLLLPLADKVLTPDEQESLLAQFERVEAEIGPGIHRGFERLAEGLEEAVQHSEV